MPEPTDTDREWAVRLLSIIPEGGDALDVAAHVIARARQDGIEQGRGDMERLEREWRADERRRIAEEKA